MPDWACARSSGQASGNLDLDRHRSPDLRLYCLAVLHSNGEVVFYQRGSRTVAQIRLFDASACGFPSFRDKS